jgi:hypothetical protein
MRTPQGHDDQWHTDRRRLPALTFSLREKAAKRCSCSCAQRRMRVRFRSRHTCCRRGRPPAPVGAPSRRGRGN